MLIYASIAINLYIRMMFLVYKRQGDYDGLPEPKPPAAMESDPKSPESKSPTKIITKKSGDEVKVK